MDEEQIAAILGMVLMTQPNREVRIPFEQVQNGLPANSGVKVEPDEERFELVVRIASFDEEEEVEE